jgi:hypothetical protein
MRSIFRTIFLLTAAAAVGWWAHDARVPVHAESSSDSPIAFQFGGTELRGSLTVYSPRDHALYVYPAAANDSHINCAFMLRIGKPGGPIERQNCSPGSPY